MNYISIIPVSTSDFYGISTVLSVSGCIHKCDGCWAKEKGGWKYTTGQNFDDAAYQYLTDLIKKDYIDNLVIQGGDPLIQHNIGEIKELCKKVKTSFPEKRIVVFTGYSYNEILKKYENTQHNDILDYIDVLIDGKYVKELPPKKFRGSSNQRILWFKDSEIIKVE